MGNELDLDNKTINSWFTLLETSFLTFKLQPYHSNFNKVIVKHQNILSRHGSIVSFIRIRSQEDLELHFAKGNIFENLVISEMYKNSINNATKSITYFWRDKSQNEVDLIVETGVRLDAIEIKSAKTIYQNQFRG
ncbi:MAG: DUF4143 domain-containing protein [Flavobacterium sp.]|nr:DUF4143 domain-containing protein [Flavobacterium sp.]